LILTLVPAGEFVMGGPEGHPDERPVRPVVIEQPFWMGTHEITNAQFARFDPSHDSRLEHGDFLQFSIQERGYPLNNPNQPVARISWDRALAFCAWLTETTGEAFALPTESQWEYAYRAGSPAPHAFGGQEFAGCANLADASLARIDNFPPWTLPVGAIPNWRPAVEGIDDGYRVSAPVGSFAANAWGLHDMCGNVAEWTRSLHRPYPYEEDDGRNDTDAVDRRVVRGGSWYDRPERATASFRLSYYPWHGVYSVGFRVVCPDTRLSQVRVQGNRVRSTS